MTTTLLAVDDSKTMRRVLEITFAGEDFRTVLCESADEALGKLGENPQVALVDAGLDNAAGYELCQKIKQRAPNVAVVMLSSKQQPYDRARGSAVGADDFVDKPFDTQQLLDKITTIARRAASAPVMAVAAAPVVMPSAAAAAKPQEATRPRVQTLAYGSNPAPNQPPSPAPPQVQPRPVVQPIVPARPATGSSPEAAARPISPIASAPAHAEPAAALPADFAGKLGGLGLSSTQVDAVLALSREVVEQVVWEVVPTLAETMIKEELKRLLQA
ncbi:MAG TPA: response regulator [Polyangiaceae bacterium]|nr:response regulator [Polyangiaceae bacterium]